MSTDPPAKPSGVHAPTARSAIDLRIAAGAERFRRLQRVTFGLAEAVTLGDVLDLMVGDGVEVAGASAGSVCLVDLGGEGARVVRSLGYSPHDLSRAVEILLDDDSPFATCIRSGEHVIDARPDDDQWDLYIPITVRGEVIGVLGLTFVEAQPFDDEQLEFLVAAARHCGAAIERSRLVDAEHQARRDADVARREAERVRDHLALLISVARSVATSLEPDEVLQSVLDLAVPRVADAAMAYLPTDEGLRRVAIAHRDPAALELGRQWVLGTHTPLDDDSPAARCFRTGEVQIRRDLDRADLSRAPTYVRRTVTNFGLQSWLAVPVQAGRQVLGVIVLAFNDPDHLDAEESDTVALTIEIANRTAAALVNASLFQRQRLVALSLQQTVLPPAMPEVDGIELAARYLPAEADTDVGGDWYDAFVLADGRIGLTIGDVTGHGLAVGATMGQLRNALRAYAIDGAAPGQVLHDLNRLLTLTTEDEFASVIYAVVDPATGAFTWASAGHPPMLRITPDAIHVLDEPHGMILGADATQPCPEGQMVLGPGEAVLLYTDGLVERRDVHLDESIAALAARLWGTSMTAENLCDVAVQPLLGSGLRLDDVCVVAVRRTATAS
ncbi:MAG: SpoIIE family protein phosphatase [Acidimicrobiia bacterium]|nr:SpoIIE family protein phosphatase [Acidimicrobiia bacterium]